MRVTDSREVDALEIALKCPLWPRREMLSATGRALYDAMVAGVKPYTLLVVDERFSEAFTLLGRFGDLYQKFNDATLINDPDPAIAENNTRLCRVFKWYADAAGVGWGAVRGAS